MGEDFFILFFFALLLHTIYSEFGICSPLEEDFNLPAQRLSAWGSFKPFPLPVLQLEMKPFKSDRETG